MKILKISTNHYFVTAVLALAKDHRDIVELLLKNGADVNVKSNDQWTPLHSASYFGKYVFFIHVH